MSMLYLASSRVTSAVLQWGLSGVSARSKVRSTKQCLTNFSLWFFDRERGAPTVADFRPVCGEQTIF